MAQVSFDVAESFLWELLHAPQSTRLVHAEVDGFAGNLRLTVVTPDLGDEWNGCEVTPVVTRQEAKWSWGID